MTYYPFWYRLNNADAFLLWYTDLSTNGTDADGVLLDASGHLLTFRDLDDLRAYANGRSLPLVSKVRPEPLDLDVVERWLGTARKTTVLCETFLEAWNLFSDLASTVTARLVHVDDRNQDRIYDKLFWGNNLPALTPPGKHYEPLWTKSEVGRLRNVLSTGLNLFRDRLRPSDALAMGPGKEAAA